MDEDNGEIADPVEDCYNDEEYKDLVDEKWVDKNPEHNVRHICIRSPFLVRRRAAENQMTEKKRRERAAAASSSSSSLSLSSEVEAPAAKREPPPLATMRRIDLVLVPYDHWPFALWGWSGSTTLSE
jgi:hypothetical protein